MKNSFSFIIISNTLLSSVLPDYDIWRWKFLILIHIKMYSSFGQLIGKITNDNLSGS